MAAVARVALWFEQHVFPPLKLDLPARKRIALMAEQLRTFYGDGSKSCLLDVLSIPGAPEEVAAALKGVMRAWIKAFTDIARESDLDANLSRSRAEEAVVRIEGALIVSRVLGDNGPFQRCMKLLPDLLTET
jgi:hypothetical protein